MLEHIKTKNTDIPVIIISGHANIEMAINSLRSGAFEFIQKPFDKERLLNFVKRAVENINLKKENKSLSNKLFHSFKIIGNNPFLFQLKLRLEEHHEPLMVGRDNFFALKTQARYILLAYFF